MFFFFGRRRLLIKKRLVKIEEPLIMVILVRVFPRLPCFLFYLAENKISRGQNVSLTKDQVSQRLQELL